MSDNLTAVLLALCFLFILVIPVWIVFHYIFKTRGARQINARDAAAFEQFSHIAARLEQRVMTLEGILDAEAPAWRSRANAGYGAMGAGNER